MIVGNHDAPHVPMHHQLWHGSGWAYRAMATNAHDCTHWQRCGTRWRWAACASGRGGCALGRELRPCPGQDGGHRRCVGLSGTPPRHCAGQRACAMRRRWGPRCPGQLVTRLLSGSINRASRSTHLCQGLELCGVEDEWDAAQRRGMQAALSADAAEDGGRETHLGGCGGCGCGG